MDRKTVEAVREWVKRDSGNGERTARWMAQTLRIGTIRECRAMVAEAAAA